MAEAAPPVVPAPAGPERLVLAFGDSLYAGYGLGRGQSLPDAVQARLRTDGINAKFVNAGVSGDTSSGGLARLDWSVPDDTDAVILELGANDMLRGIDPKITRSALEEIVGRLKARHVEVLLCGMRAQPNLGPDYARAFDAIYPQLAAANGLIFYPFFLDGVVTDAKLNQSDGMHPTAAGVAVIVERIMPQVMDLLARVQAKTAAKAEP
jgi:acyl-CoA thioesterase-1